MTAQQPTAASVKKVLVAHEAVLNRVVEMLASSNGAVTFAGLLSAKEAAIDLHDALRLAYATAKEKEGAKNGQ